MNRPISLPDSSGLNNLATQLEHFVDATAVAVHLKIKKRQVLALTRAGKLPAHPIDPTAERKIWRYRLSEIDAAIAGSLPEVETASARYNDARQPRHQKAR